MLKLTRLRFYDDKGRFNGSRDIVRDVTQRVFLEKERVENELRLSQTVDVHLMQ